jgi:hypothetical protein
MEAATEAPSTGIALKVASCFRERLEASNFTSPANSGLIPIRSNFEPQNGSVQDSVS